MEVFQEYINETIVELPYGEQEVSEGSIEHTGLNHTSHFEVLPAVVSEEEVASILALVDDDGLELDSDPDTVDGMVRAKYSRLSLSLSLAHSPPLSRPRSKRERHAHSSLTSSPGQCSLYTPSPGAHSLQRANSLSRCPLTTSTLSRCISDVLTTHGPCSCFMFLFHVPVSCFLFPVSCFLFPVVAEATHEIFVESTDLYDRMQKGWMPGTSFTSFTSFMCCLL